MNTERYINEILRKIRVGRKTKKRLREDLTQDVEEQLSAGLALSEIIGLMGEPNCVAAKIQESYPYRKRSKPELVFLIGFICSAAASAFQLFDFLLIQRISMLFNRPDFKDASAIGIIGGADGPTAIYVSNWAKTGSALLPLLLPAVCAISGITYFILRKRRKEK